MRLSELLLEAALDLKTAGWLQRNVYEFSKYGVNYKKHYYGGDVHTGTRIDVVSSNYVYIQPQYSGAKIDLPIPPFGTIQSDFHCDELPEAMADLSFLPLSCQKLSLRKNEMKSLKGIHTKCKKLDVSYNQLTSLEGVPDGCEEIIAQYNPITSLVGIADQIKSMSGQGYLMLSLAKIREGGLGLALIPGLKGIGFSGKQAKNSGAWKIIEKYFGRPDDVFECQEELINAGFEEYAKI